jgi:hypothetical protein
LEKRSARDFDGSIDKNLEILAIDVGLLVPTLFTGTIRLIGKHYHLKEITICHAVGIRRSVIFAKRSIRQETQYVDLGNARHYALGRRVSRGRGRWRGGG